MKPTNAVTHHASLRGQQRWGVTLDVDEIERQLSSGEAEVYEYQNKVIWKMVVTAEGKRVPIVYHRERKAVLTVLPERELQYVQSEFGMGFASKEDKREFRRGLSFDRRRALDIRRDDLDAQSPFFNLKVVEQAKKRMARFDALPADVRRVVHEYGLEIVWEFWEHDIRSGDDMVVMIKAARRMKSAMDDQLVPLFRHYGVRTRKAVFHLSTAARMEPPPTNQGQTRYRTNTPPKRKQNALVKGKE